MTLQEHQAILAFLDQATSGPREPLDVEADAIIRAYFKRNPDAAFHVTKLAMALAEPRRPAAQPEKDDTRRWRWFPAMAERKA